MPKHPSVKAVTAPTPRLDEPSTKTHVQRHTWSIRNRGLGSRSSGYPALLGKRFRFSVGEGRLARSKG